MASIIPLDLETLKKLTTDGFERPEQFGPVRWFDKEMRCATRRCNSPTYIRLNRIPTCMIHAIRELNDMIVKGGELMSEQTPEQTDEGADAGSENTALPDQAAGSEAAGEAGTPAGSPSVPAGENADTTSDEPQGDTADNTEGAE